MLGMTSRYFHGLLMCVVTALSLSKPNAAWARPQVSETGAGFSLAWGREPPFRHLQLVLTGLCVRQPLSPASIFHREEGDCGQARRRPLT